MSVESKIVLCTLEYPFGLAESYLETEIHYLASHFDLVHIIPSRQKGHERKTPKNVIIHKVDNTQFRLQVIPSVAYLGKILFYTLISSPNRFNYLRYIKSFLHHFYNDFRKREAIKTIVINNNLRGAIFYDYWLVNSSLSLISLKNIGIIRGPIVSRAHGFDLYDERHMEGEVPFQKFKIHNLDCVFPISSHGCEYLKNKFPKESSRIKKFYLGIEPGRASELSDNILTMVSCSSMLPFKQVPLLARAISILNVEAKWVHFGDGPEMPIVRSIAQNLSKSIEVVLPGNVENKEVLHFYRSNHVAVFISLSKYEGLPVSMMEAQAHGIPIVAIAVNGVPEIVTSDTGVRLTKSSNMQEITTILQQVLTGRISFDREKILSHFNRNFTAKGNYSEFCTHLKSLIN